MSAVGWKPKAGLTKITEPTPPKAATIPTLPINWRKLSRQANGYPGIAICGSGNGINMTLNKHQGIRAALCWTAEIAHLARQHNDANVLVMPGRFIGTEEADMIMTEFFNTSFEGGRHQRRIDKIPVQG